MGYKALVYSDLQATDGHERLFNKHDVPLQIWRVRKTYADLLKIFKKHKCDCLWDLGDTTDDRSLLPMPAIDAVMEGLEPFPVHELNIKLIGNHEQYLRDTSLHIGRMFASKFAVIPQTDLFEVEDALIACAAYPASDATLTEWLNKTAYAYRNYARKLLLGHFQVVGCALNSGQAVMGIPLDACEKFNLALLGHVHKPQRLGRNTHYVGSPFQQNYGEKYEEKRVAIVDLSTFKVEWVPMEGFPLYRIVTFEEWAKLVRKDSEDRYQVIISSNDDAEQFYKHPLMAYGDPIYDFAMPKDQQEEIEKQQHWNQADMMERWMKEHKPEDYGIQAPRDEVLELGRYIAIGNVTDRA